MAELKKILYAEDEQDIQTIVEMAIQAMSSYDIKICNNGKELVDCVEDFAPDLVLLDVMMPEMDGPTTFKTLKMNAKTNKIPVIFMTAKAQAHELEVYKDSGVIGIITKPFDPMDLCNNISKIWNDFNSQDDLVSKLNALKNEYLNKLKNILAELKFLIKNDEINVSELYSRIHTISGTSGMYGMHDLSTISTEFEFYLKGIKDNDTVYDSEMLLEKLSYFTDCLENIILAGGQ